MHTLKSLTESLNRLLEEYPELADKEIKVTVPGKTYRTRENRSIHSTGFSPVNGERMPHINLNLKKN